MKNKFFVITAMMIIFTFCFTGCGENPTPENPSYSISYDEPVGYFINFNCSGNISQDDDITLYEGNSAIMAHIEILDGFETNNLQVLVNGTASIVSGSGSSYTVSFTITQNTTIEISGVQPILRTVGLQNLKTNYFIVLNNESSVYTENTVQIDYNQTCKIKLIPKYNYISAPNRLFYIDTSSDFNYEFSVPCCSTNYLEPLTDSQGSRTFELVNTKLNSDTIDLQLSSSLTENFATLLYNRFYNITQVSSNGEVLENTFLNAFPNNTVYLQISAANGEDDGYILEGLDTCTLLINGRQYSRNNDGFFVISNVVNKLSIEVQGLSLVNQSATDTYYKIDLQNDTLIQNPIFQNQYGCFFTNKDNKEQYVKTGMSVSIPNGYQLVSLNGATTFETTIDNTNDTPLTVYTITSINGDDVLKVQTTNTVTIPVSTLIQAGYEVYYRTTTNGDYTQLTNSSSNVITVSNNGSFTLKLKYTGEINYNYPQFIQENNEYFMFYVKAQGCLSGTNTLTPIMDLFNMPIIEDSSYIYIIQKTNSDINLQIRP